MMTLVPNTTLSMADLHRMMHEVLIFFSIDPSKMGEVFITTECDDFINFTYKGQRISYPLVAGNGPCA